MKDKFTINEHDLSNSCFFNVRKFIQQCQMTPPLRDNYSFDVTVENKEREGGVERVILTLSKEHLYKFSKFLLILQTKKDDVIKFLETGAPL